MKLRDQFVIVVAAGIYAACEEFLLMLVSGSCTNTVKIRPRLDTLLRQLFKMLLKFNNV